MRVETDHIRKRVIIGANTKQPDIVGIDEFFIYTEERRKLRKGKIAKIRTAFDNKDKMKRHFAAPMVVNRVNGKYNLLDGNHRIEAIREKLDRDNTFEIEVDLAVYSNLTRDEERQVYTKWSIGTPENATDTLQNYWLTIPLGDTLLRELPVAVYPTDKKLAVKLVFGAHHTANRQNFNGGYGAGGEKTVSDMQQLTDTDIKIMKAWYKDYSEIFGDYQKGNAWYNSTPLTALYKVWFDNRTAIPRDKLIKMWKTIFYERTTNFLQNIKAGGRESAIIFYNIALQELINGPKSQKKIKWIGRGVSVYSPNSNYDDGDNN